MHVPSSIEAEESEEIGVEHLLRDVKNLSVGTLSSRVSDQLSSLKGLGHRLVEIREYLKEVCAGKLPVNHQIVYHLQDVFNLLPNLDAAARSGPIQTGGATLEEGGGGGGKRPFTVATNDQLLVMYLSSLIRAVIALHDLVLNKQTAAHVEENGGTGGAKEGEEKEKEGEAAATAAAAEDGTKGGKGGGGGGGGGEEKSDQQKAKDWFKGDEQGH